MPKRKTAAQIKAQGTARPDRVRQDARVKPLKRLPRVADDMAKDVRELWRELGQRCIERQTLTQGDLVGLRLAAEAVAASRRCAAQVAEDGPTAVGASGQATAHPLLIEGRQWQSTARQWLVSLGLTPSSRSAVESVAPPPEPSEFASFLTGGGLRPVDSEACVGQCAGCNHAEK